MSGLWHQGADFIWFYERWRREPPFSKGIPPFKPYSNNPSQTRLKSDWIRMKSDYKSAKPYGRYYMRNKTPTHNLEFKLSMKHRGNLPKGI